jgi:hypothetical protein
MKNIQIKRHLIIQLVILLILIETAFSCFTLSSSSDNSGRSYTNENEDNKNYTMPTQNSNSGTPSIKPVWKSFSDPFASSQRRKRRSSYINSTIIQQRIVAGEEAIPNSYPWQVSLAQGTFHFCAGSLIFTNYVLTAGHCCEYSNTGNLQVRVGAHNLNSPTTYSTYSVSKIIIHGKFDSDTLANDICLLKLTNSVTLGTKVNTIRIPSSRSRILNKRVAIIGW